MKTIKQLLTVICCLMILISGIPAFADDGYSTSYTYTYDYWGDVQESPDAYRVATIINTQTIGLEKLNNVRLNGPKSMFAHGDNLYICDTTNNRIIKLRKAGSQFILDEKNGVISELKLNAEMEAELAAKAAEAAEQADTDPAGAAEPEEESQPEGETPAAETETAAPENTADTPDNTETPEGQGGEETEQAPEADAAEEMRIRKTTFLNPLDVAVDTEGNIYVADNGHQRIVKFDQDLNIIREFVKPTDATFDQSLSFLPKKIVVDVAGRVYALCQNVNKGLVKYEADASFSGFIGANAVSVSMVEYIWKRYFMTKEQRAQSESFVPTEYENIYIDKDGFIYATNTVFSEYDLKSDAAKPIRRLNSTGTDILIKNDRYPPIGDLDWVEGAANDNTTKYRGPSQFTDITVMDNDIYIGLDRTRGRIFGYDSQGILLWVFGTTGNTDGAFSSAVSIEHMGYELFVLDDLKNSITVFTPTEYGRTIYEASEKYLDGKYDESAELWQDVLKMNANYPLAFRGIGRAVMRQNEYQKAMDYFELAHDRENYGRAFKLYRKEWIEQNILWIILIVAGLLIIPLVIGRIKRMKWEVSEHERGKIRK